MRLLAQAVRAVFVELIGVVAVLWLLFGAATWTVDSWNYSNSNPVVRLKPVLAAPQHSVAGYRWGTLAGVTVHGVWP
jgi:hypothetical protein